MLTNQLLIALRFLKSSYIQKSISSLVKICFFTILLSTFSLTLITFIMNGFEIETYKIFKNIHSDLIIKSKDQAINDIKIGKILREEFKDTIEAYSPIATSQIILQFQKNHKSFQALMVLKGIDPEKEFSISNLNSLKENGILIGKTFAEKLNIQVGDNVILLYPSNQINQNKIELEQFTAVIAGIYQTGIEDYEEQIIYTNLNFFNEISDSGIYEINLKLKNIKEENKVLEKLRKRFYPLEVFSWKKMYPALIDALLLEKYVMILIMLLILLLASINAISLIYIFIIQKKVELVILKAHGFQEKTIKTICALTALYITIPANLIGTFLGILISIILKYLKIPLSSSYFVQYLPIEINFYLIFYILIFTLIILILTAWIPTKKIKNLSIVYTLKSRN